MHVQTSLLVRCAAVPNRWPAEYAFDCVGKRWPDAVHLDTCKVL
jgi:hypothetical protein